MKRLALTLMAVFVFAIACGGGETPDKIVKKSFDAVQNADGNALLGNMCAEAVVELNEVLEGIQESPEESSVISITEITAEEVENMTTGDFVSALLRTEVFLAVMPDFSNMVIGEATISGDTAIVPVTVDFYTEDIELVFEGDSWKISGGVLDFVLTFPVSGI